MHGLGTARLRRRVLPFSLLSLTAFGIAWGQTGDPQLKEHSLAAETFVGEKLGIWQQRLKLQDWNVTFRMVRATELKPKTLGNIHWDSTTKTASISVLSLADYRLAYPEALRDMEFTVVHELIHLQLSSLPRSDASRGAEERAVNQITEALLQLSRNE